MSSSPRAATAKLVVIYWAMILFGLAIFVGLRIDTPDPIAASGALCAGTLLGTALGQIVAWRRMRMWIAALLVVTLGIVVLPQLRDELQGKSLWLTFLPAALCGYWSLGDRTSLAAFWFPAMLWMLSILDRVETNALPGGTGLALFVALVALFFIFLRVREERRISLWRTVAPSPLADVTATVVLQQPGGLEIARGVWGLVAASLTLLATAWLAPMLWTPESLDAGSTLIANSDLGLPCCPKYDQAPVTHQRVKEYLDLDRGVEHTGAPKPGVDCKVCDATAVVAGEYESMADYAYRPAPTGAYDDYGMPTTATRAAMPGPSRSGAVPSYAPAPAAAGAFTPTPAPAPAPHVARFTPPPTPTPPPIRAEPPPAPIEPIAPPPIVHHRAPLYPPPTSAGVAPRPSTSHSIIPDVLHWAAVFAAAALLFQLFTLALRPVRRFVALRHFRRPYWDETIDQRVSNAWQLALVGLRDAGFRPTANEQPAALARRVPIAGLERCATILDRARHGVGLDQDDLATMTSSATDVYSNARSQLGTITRATSWLRWPLV